MTKNEKRQNSKGTEIHSLILSEEIRLFVRKRLREHARQFPESKFAVVSWTDDVDVIIAQEVNNFLVDEQCPERLKKGGDIIGRCRAQFDRLTKNKRR